MKPQDVQGRPHIRVLFAKDAVSTGWDCPRAEVLMSFRPAKDQTHITQLLGRMVRTPLARRIAGNDRLNSVRCVLPHFDRATANRVAQIMIGDRDLDADGTGGGEGRRVIVEPVETEENKAIDETVWSAYESVSSQTLPRKTSNPVQRLADLCQALSQDGLRVEARRFAYDCLFKKLDGLLAQHQSDVANICKDLWEMKGETLIVRVGTGKDVGRRVFVEPADERAIMAEFKSSFSTFTKDVSSGYARYLVRRGGYDGLDVYVRIAALARVPTVDADISAEAGRVFDELYTAHRASIRKLSDDRQVRYDQIMGASAEPQSLPLLRPRIRYEDASSSDGDRYPTRRQHLTCGPDGTFPVGKLNNLEMSVLDKELAEPGFLAWYRNPNRPSKDALAIAYEIDSGNWKRMFPDFLFFANGSGRSVRPSIVDPHGHHLGDILPKLRGLAGYAEEFGNVFHRIEAVSEMKSGKIRVLDLQQKRTREAILEANSAEALYNSTVANNYM